MAISKNHSIEIFGKTLGFNNAYIKIISIEGTKDNITMYVNIYDSNEKVNVIDNERYTFIPNVSDIATNFIKQGYEYLKTLDEYKDAIDLLDEGQTA